ncbi:TPA: shikimate dehydrogenase [Candidatus Woesearchaeota archaeon]|nr:shikimate dehydrogenase [Candidatus Woesearchaeota archaeon]HII69564.1 shikimate dehydrogenase [Candidatus Woesearchaeota archaeon]
MICVPIACATNDEIVREAQAAMHADVIELRIDSLREEPDLTYLLASITKPVIVTNRVESEGGKARKSDARIAVLCEACSLGAAYVDIEYASGAILLDNVLKAKGQTKVIVSHHDFSGVPDGLERLYERMKITRADVLKIAVTARTITDNLAVFALLKRATKEGIDLIALCMGAHGEISRILGPMFGSYLTFGSLDSGKETAPGQIPSQELSEVYRVTALGHSTKIYGLVGNPVDKSKGYLLHNKAFAAAGVNAVYAPFLVDDLKGFVQGFRDTISGFSVTMPHKESIIPLLDVVSDDAKAIGSVNTVIVEDGKLIGSNTDGKGAVDALREVCEVSGGAAVVVGTGGAAKAIAHQLHREGCRVIVAGRNSEKARAIAARTSGVSIPLGKIRDTSFDILVNATPIGMAPNTEVLPVSKSILSGKVVLDAVYNPPETLLLREAKKLGCKTISGVDMFVNQAALQYSLWTGKAADMELMKGAVLESLLP